MIELGRHIEILLLDNDCVIVPGFGGFVAHHLEARFDDRDNTYLPPMRTLGFNPKLSMNDSLLAQSYVEAYDMSYPEALKHMDAEVDELKETLEKEGFFELNDVGTLMLNEEGNYEFEPCESGILTPELYGLTGYEISPIEHRANDGLDGEAQIKESNTASRISPEDMPLQGNPIVKPLFGESKLANVLSTADEPEHEKTIQIRVSVLRRAMAIACGILFFFMMSTPINTGMYHGGQRMSSVSNSLMYNLMPQDAPVREAKAEKFVRANAKAVTTAPVKQEMQESSLKVQMPEKTKIDNDTERGYYCIVLASHITRPNAENFVEKLHKDGYSEARVLDKNGNYLKVVYGEYETEGKACEILKSLRHNETFEQGWVLHVK